ncbi:hypothetical protein ACOMHN_017526 [Nucella lapillus]
MAICKSVPAIHVFAVILGSLEIILFGGVIFGWHSIVYVYKDMGYFSDLCHQADQPNPRVDHNNTIVQTLNLSSLSTTTTASSVIYGLNTSRNALPFSTTSAISNESRVAYKTVRLSPEDSVRFEELSCEERMKVNSEGRVSAVCEAQDEQFNLIFSLATGINGIMSFPSGVLYDILGTRISRIVCLVSYLVGQICLILASPSAPYLLYPGFVGLVYGGYQILLTNLQLSGLIPSLKSTIMSLYSGSYDTSASIFLLFKAAHEGGVSVSAAFTFQATLFILIVATTTFFFFPKGRVPFPLTPRYRLRCYLCHKFCGWGSSTLEQKNTFASGEWKIDANGSVILARDVLDQGLSEPSPDLNGRALGSKELDNDGDGGGELLPRTEEQNLNPGDGGDGDAQGKVTASPSSIDNGDAKVPPEQEIEVLSRSESKMTPNNKQTSPAKRRGPEQSPQELESILLGGEKKTEGKSFRQVALSPLFLTDLLWISVQRLRSWIFVGMFNPWITRLACGDKALVSHYTSVYAALQFFGILTAPLSGRLMDRKIKGAEKYGDPRYERLHAAIASFVLNSTVSVLLTVCTLIPVLKLQYLTFVLHCLHRSFLYGPNSAFVANAFPNKHFGKLFGITLTVSALFSMLQYPLFLIMQGPLAGDPLAINVFLLVLMLISYIHPIYIWRYLQRKVSKAAATT